MESIRITNRIANWNGLLQTSIEYAYVASDVSADMLRDPITYALLCFLRLRRHFACAD